MEHQPEFWIIAGVNGAGKTTTVRNAKAAGLIGEVVYLNPDELTLEIRKSKPGIDLIEANLEAARTVEKLVESYLLEKKSVAVETVLSSSKYEPYIDLAKKNGFEVNMLYIGLKNVERSIDRVAERVKAGGHDVPEEKIRTRWVKSHDNLAKFTPKLDRLFVYSNDRLDQRLLVAIKQDGKIHLLNDQALPEVTKRLQPFIQIQKNRPHHLEGSLSPHFGKGQFLYKAAAPVLPQEKSKELVSGIQPLETRERSLAVQKPANSPSRNIKR